jgi:hypothetical protein
VSSLAYLVPISMTPLARMLTQAPCGENLLLKALDEVGFMQYLEKARTAKDQAGRMTRGHQESMKKRAVRIETYLGREVGLVVEWIGFGLIVGGFSLGWW